jgi:endo-1,3-1,4-beta-glycanase ExoK
METGCRKEPAAARLKSAALGRSQGRWWPVWVGVLACLGMTPAVRAGKPAPAPPKAQSTFTDLLSGFDSTRWTMADKWANGSPFDNGWLADHVTVQGGFLDIRLDDVTSSGQPYSSGEYRTTGYYGYGCYEARFKPVAQPGVVTSFFTFAGPYDNGGNGKHNEIDIEFLGKDTSRVQFNFWTNDDAYASSHEKLVDLGFDASKEFRNYGFKWTSSSIGWYIDGTLIYTFTGDSINPIPQATQSLQKIMMNVWPVDATASAWAGTFVYPGQALHGVYDWVRYVAGENCNFDNPPGSSLPPPTGGATSVSVQQVAMSLDARATQAIASVTVVDDIGMPVAGASVSGAWSGVITTGDTSRTTDSRGLATFYSSRSRNPGSVTFCVTGVKAGSLAYVESPGTCGTITK